MVQKHLQPFLGKNSEKKIIVDSCSNSSKDREDQNTGENVSNKYCICAASEENENSITYLRMGHSCHLFVKYLPVFCLCLDNM